MSKPFYGYNKNYISMKDKKMIELKQLNHFYLCFFGLYQPTCCKL